MSVVHFRGYCLSRYLLPAAIDHGVSAIREYCRAAALAVFEKIWMILVVRYGDQSIVSRHEQSRQ